jgi:hypothetical protein
MILRHRSEPISCACPGRNGFQPTPGALTEDTLADSFRIARYPGPIGGNRHNRLHFGLTTLALYVGVGLTIAACLLEICRARRP